MSNPIPESASELPLCAACGLAMTPLRSLYDSFRKQRPNSCGSAYCDACGALNRIRRIVRPMYDCVLLADDESDDEIWKRMDELADQDSRLYDGNFTE